MLYSMALARSAISRGYASDSRAARAVPYQAGRIIKRVAYSWICLCTLSSFAQLHGQETMPFDHVHMAVPEPLKAAAWYAEHLGGAPGLTPDRVVFGTTIVAFQKASGDIQPSDGTILDHIALSVADPEAKARELSESGGKLLEPARDVPGLFRVAFVQDPWGAKIELVQDPEFRGFHHIHLRVPDSPAALEWYQRMFGGERNKLRGRIDGILYGKVWLLAERSGQVVSLSKGHAIDHIGWRPDNVDEKITELRAKGAVIASEPRAYNDLRFAFVEGPAGVLIELTQRPKR
jgi:catechol 2,3-dioxygenase-like lactoylglutathione lyase family enzyme